jgi:hypothetical protein
MPFDPRDPDANAEELVVQVDRGGRDDAYLLVIARPTSGSVRVREWSSENWAGPATERVVSVDEVYARIERAVRERRRVSVELPRLRAWLGREAP